MKNLFCFLCAAGVVSGVFLQKTLADPNIIEPVTALGPSASDPNATPARVKIVEPLNGSIFPHGTQIHVAAQTEASQGFVKTVEFFADDKSIGVAINNPLSASPVNPFQLAWKDAPPGEHVLTAKATDDSGRTTQSEAVHINVLTSADATIVTIYASAPEALESGPGRSGVFKVVRTGTLKTKLNVHYVISGTARNGIDYDELSGTSTIPAGESSAPILIKPVADKALEGTETVILTLEQRVYIVAPPPEEDYLVGEPKSATVFIVGNSTRDFPPKVDIVLPKEGAVFAEHKTIKVGIQTADADGYVPRVELYDGDHLIDSETRNFLIKPPPGEIENFLLEWKDAPAGEHKLIAKAIDDSGLRSTSSPVRITVGRQSDVPVVTIISVDGEASEGDPKNTAIFQVIRTGSAKTALHVYYEIGGNAENGADYKKLPGMVTIPAGTLDARVVVTSIPDKKQEGKELVTLTLVQRIFKAAPGPEDNYQVGSPRTATIVISNTPHENVPPKITIGSPKNGAEFLFHADVEIKAEASDPEGEIREVDFFADEGLLVSFKTPPFRFIWKNVEAGKHVLRAKAVDDVGASSMSESVTVVVRERVPAGFVKRQLPDIYTPGETFKVVLEASPGDTVQVYAVEERPPKGWTVGAINEGGSFDAASNEVKFGPFFDNKARTLTYEITPPANASGPKEFGGVASANGVNSEIGGDRLVAPRSTRHPADLDPADNRITIQELTAYALAWKTGKDWSVGPNPIPQSYVTRAGEIWRRGETYSFDPAQGPAPLWWVPKQSAALLGVASAVVVPGDVTEHPGRAMRSFERIGNGDHVGYSVTITILPNAGVNAYTIEEHAPAGWGVSDISNDGAYDKASGKIRWGIFLDDQARTLTYHVTPAANDAHHHGVFEGVASFDGIDVPIHSDKEPDHGGGNALGKLKNIHRYATGECEVSFSGEAGQHYKFQVSTNLVDWIDLGPAVNEAGDLQVFDTDATNSSIRYYRAILSE